MVTRQVAGWPREPSSPFRILVVEDEQLMRSIIVQLLRSEGYEVIEAASATGCVAASSSARKSTSRFST